MDLNKNIRKSQKGVNFVEKKAKYDPAKIELVYFEEIDIITSSNVLGDSGIDYSGWTTTNGDWS